VDEERIRQSYERAHDPSRVLALSDGVFAIIITLLVLEIHVPDLAQGQSLREALEEIRPSLTAFLISFVFVAIAWAGHRDIFSLIRRIDRALVWLNIIYLLPLCILPFGASLIARFEKEPVALRNYGLLLLPRYRGWVSGGTRAGGRISCSRRSTGVRDARASLSWRFPASPTRSRSASRMRLRPPA
jgi:hypothetical protein